MSIEGENNAGYFVGHLISSTSSLRLVNCLSKLAGGGGGGGSGKDPPPIVTLAAAAVVALSCIRAGAAAAAVGNRPCMGVYFALRGYLVILLPSRYPNKGLGMYRQGVLVCFGTA
ncbi:hypothetical protein OIU77_014855 [Salix suchowensis]|uniref:Uncharacterized protein n=1 Tax=Salix suchowensis TaxID=1278906 RepID=A0ABQ8ZZB2_9ROSI|nr:hypothetical protein OIU77_014855 [Salix suchowensis]